MELSYYHLKIKNMALLSERKKKMLNVAEFIQIGCSLCS